MKAALITHGCITATLLTCCQFAQAASVTFSLFNDNTNPDTVDAYGSDNRATGNDLTVTDSDTGLVLTLTTSGSDRFYSSGTTMGFDRNGDGSTDIDDGDLVTDVQSRFDPSDSIAFPDESFTFSFGFSGSLTGFDFANNFAGSDSVTFSSTTGSLFTIDTSMVDSNKSISTLDYDFTSSTLFTATTTTGNGFAFESFTLDVADATAVPVPAAGFVGMAAFSGVVMGRRRKPV